MFVLIYFRHIKFVLARRLVDILGAKKKVAHKRNRRREGERVGEKMSSILQKKERKKQDRRTQAGRGRGEFNFHKIQFSTFRFALAYTYTYTHNTQPTTACMSLHVTRKTGVQLATIPTHLCHPRPAQFHPNTHTHLGVRWEGGGERG